MRRTAYGIILALVACPVLAQTRSDRPAVRQRVASTIKLLDSRVPEVSFEGAPFEQVMEWLGEYTGVNVVVRWQQLEDLGVERDKPISIKVRNLKLSQVLWMIMNEAGGPDVKLAYRATGNLLVLSTHEDLGKDMIVKVYDVGDLLVRIPRFTNAAQLNPGQALNQLSQGGFGGGGGGGGGSGQLFEDEDQDDQRDDENAAEGDMQRLIQVIMDTIEPDSWNLNGGPGSITPLRNQIIVRNSILVHQLLGGYLDEDEIAR